MDPTRLMTQTATITHVTGAGPVDDYGDPTEETTISAVACWLHQTQAVEDTRGGQISAEGWTMYLPGGTTVDTDDRVIVGGVSYEVAGPPWQAINPRTGIEEFVQVPLQKAG